jgi:hypothetical protein
MKHKIRENNAGMNQPERQKTSTDGLYSILLKKKLEKA